MKVSSYEDPHSITASSLHVAVTDLHAGSTFLTYRAHGARAKPPGYCIPENSLTVELQDWTQIKAKPGIGYHILCLHRGRPQQVPHHISVCTSSLIIRIICLSHHNLFISRDLTIPVGLQKLWNSSPCNIPKLSYLFMPLAFKYFPEHIVIKLLPFILPSEQQTRSTTLRYTSVSSNSFKGRVMALAIRCWPLNAATRVLAWVCPCGICGGQSGTGGVFLRILRFSTVHIILP
jgi:hypothetical protein